MKQFFTFTDDPVSDTFATICGVISNHKDHKLFLWQNNGWFTINNVLIQPKEKFVQISIVVSFSCCQDKDYPLSVNYTMTSDDVSRSLIGLGRGFGSEILFQQARFVSDTGVIIKSSSEHPILLLGSI